MTGMKGAVRLWRREGGTREGEAVCGSSPTAHRMVAFRLRRKSFDPRMATCAETAVRLGLAGRTVRGGRLAAGGGGG